MLIYPSLALLKKSIHHIHITVLVPQYTADMAEICPWIDDYIIDPGSDTSFYQQYKLFNEIRNKKFDSIVTIYSTLRVGLLAFLARIKYRLAPATKIAQIFYNHRLTQRRSRSQKPEFEYNLDLIKKFLYDFNIKPIAYVEAPFLKFKTEDIDALRKNFYEKHEIAENLKLIFVHPGTGGSANNISLDQFANLIQQLKPKLEKNYYFIITAGPNEVMYAESLAKKIVGIPHVIFNSTEGLINFAKHIQLCSLFISGSTGPLHIAGALNIPTVAFYQRLRSATPLRWQTLNSNENRLAFTPPNEANETDMKKIDTTKAAQEIVSFYY